MSRNHAANKDVTIPSPLQALLLLGWGEGGRPYVMRIWPHWSLRGQVTYSCIRWHPSAQKNRRRSGETPRPIIQTPIIDVLTDHSLEPWARYRDIPHPYRKNTLPWEQTTCQWCCRLPGSRVYSARRGLWLRVALFLSRDCNAPSPEFHFPGSSAGNFRTRQTQDKATDYSQLDLTTQVLLVPCQRQAVAMV